MKLPVALLPFGQVVEVEVTIHSPDVCHDQDACCIHNPSDHHMKDWPMLLREDRHMLMERICPHGVGHPDPDSLAWVSATMRVDEGSHGCDGCCNPKAVSPE